VRDAVAPAEARTKPEPLRFAAVSDASAGSGDNGSGTVDTVDGAGRAAAPPALVAAGRAISVLGSRGSPSAGAARLPGARLPEGRLPGDAARPAAPLVVLEEFDADFEPLPAVRLRGAAPSTGGGVPFSTSRV
jgi:hypothetical protein